MAVHSIDLQEPSKEPSSPLTQAGEVAIRYLEQTGQARKNQSFMIFQHTAEQAAKLGASHQYIEFEAASLKAIVAPDSSKDPSGWISQLWKDLEKNQERWSQGMTETAKVMGLDFAPLLMKVPGSPAKYQLLAKPVGETGSESETWTVPPGGLRYTPAAVAAPGVMINATLRHGVVSHVLPLVIFAVACLVASACLVLVVGWWMFSVGVRMNSPVTTAHLSYLLIWAVFSLLVYKAFRFVGDLGDLGIVMAPDILVPFKEDHVTLEVRRDSPDKEVKFAFVRYAGICPACGGTVLLHDGQQEFIGRIVGRCRLSPREHVFSFDQKLYIGHPLREKQVFEDWPRAS